MDRGTDRKSVRSMTTNYVVVLVVLAIIAFGNFYIMRASIQGEQTTAAVINVSGRQRMLLQRSAMFAQRLLVERDDASRLAFLNTIKLMQRSHDGLIKGDEELGLPGITSPGVRAVFFDSPVNLDRRVKKFIVEASAFASDPVEELTFNNPHLIYIQERAASDLLDSFDMLVRKYQSESEGVIKWIATLTALLFAISLAVLIFMGFAVFRPIVHRIGIEMENISGAQAKISAVVGSMMDGLVTFDEIGSVETVNKAALAIFGHSEEEIVGQSVNKFIPKLLKNGRVDADAASGFMRETSAKRSDGFEFPLEFSLSEVLVADRRLYVATVRDISERKRIEQEIILKNQELEQANKLKSEFLANMSHELRTPLNSIIGFSEVLKDGVTGKLNAEQEEYATDIFESGHHLLSLVNDILDLAKIEAGRMTLMPEVVDVGGVIEKSVSMLKEKALDKGLKISMKIEEGIEGIVLDGRKFKQIIYNLLSNAVKFTDSGGSVSIEASMVKIDSKEFFEVVVSDNGIGIAPDELDKLFTPFVQLDASMSRRYEGTGLGLAMVKRLMGLHNGTVRVESETAKGTSFTIRFPTELEVEPLLLLKNKGVGEQSSRGALDERVEAPVVLIVEDDDAAAEIIRIKLINEGLRVVRVESAEEALEEVAIRPPDLIILDIMLPGMDGWDFLTRIKEHETLSHTPVVIVSILAEENRKKGFSLGAAKILQKPIDNEQLISALSEVGGFGAFNTEGAKVLVVDDDPKAVEIVALHLENRGFEVLRAYGGSDAIELATAEIPALILLDLMMPEVNGFDVVSALSSNADTARIPIIILTAKYITDEDRRILNGGIARIVRKSDFNHGNFLSEVRRAMQSGNTGSPGPFVG